MSEEPTCISINFGDIKISERDMKGYAFELETNNVLHSLKIEYLSNPLQSIEVWKSRQGKGSDFKIPLWNWEIESKYSDGKVFPSWIDRDWITRFKNGTFKVTVHNRGMKLSTNSLEQCFIHEIYLVEIDYLKYVLKAEIKARTRANKLVEAKNSKKEVRSFYNRVKTFVLNLLFNLWNDKTGNVALTKKPRTFTWKPKYGFQVAPNQFQMRLMKQTYPCQYKFLVWCTKYKKFKYLCKLSNSFLYVFDTSIRLYKNKRYCFCNGDPEEYCSAHDAMCYYNMDREEKCRWHKPRMIEQELMAKAIEWKKPKSSGKKMVKVSRM